MSPLFSVPETELTPEYIPLPNGHYDADFSGVELTGNDNGWKAVAASFENFAQADGRTEVSTTFKGKDITLQLGSRKKTTRYTVASNNAQAVEIGGRDIVRLAVALGVARKDDDGRVAIEGETPEEVVEVLNAARGKRVRLSIKQKIRTRHKEIVLNAKGEPITDDEVASVWDPSAEA